MKFSSILYFKYDFFMVVNSDKATIIKNISYFLNNTIDVYGKVNGDEFSFLHSKDLLNMTHQTNGYFFSGHVFEDDNKMIVYLKARVNKYFHWLFVFACFSGLLFYPMMYLTMKEDEFIQSSNIAIFVSLVFPLLFYSIFQISYRDRINQVKKDFIKIKIKSELKKEIQ